MNIQEVTTELERLEKEIQKAERDLATAEGQKELLLKQGKEHGVSNVKDAQKKKEEYLKQMKEYEIEIDLLFKKLKSEFEW